MASPREVACHVFLLSRIISLMLLIQTTNSQNENLFSCYRTMRASVKGVPSFESISNVEQCSEGGSCILLEINALMLIENQSASGNVVFGGCLLTSTCETNCETLSSLVLSSLPFQIEVKNCNSTCCSSDLCNTDGSENVITTENLNLTSETSDTDEINGVNEESDRNCGDATLLASVELPNTLTHAWIDGVFNNFACSWQITAPVGYMIQLTVVTFEIESCCENVTLTNPLRNDVSDVLTGRIEAGRNFYSSSNQLHISFTSNSSYSQSGFSFAYMAIEGPVLENQTSIQGDGLNPECCSVINATIEAQTLTSTNFPSSYPANQKCGWVILAPVGLHVKVKANLVDVEYCCDHLEISEPSSIPFAFATGNTYISQENILLINFSSDGDIQLRGFQLTYQAVRSSLNSQDLCKEREHNALVGVEQYFNSPDYPNKYDDNLSCTYAFRAPSSNYRIRYHFELFDIENCCDYLYVYDPLAENEHGISMSGVNDNKVRYSNSSVLMVQFTTDASVTRKGFIMVYTVVAESEIPDQAAQDYFQTTPSLLYEGSSDTSTTSSLPPIATNPCTYNLFATNTSKLLHSPNWPASYDANLNCIWVLRAGEGKHVQLSFITFNTEKCCDYVTIHNGISETNRLSENEILRMSPFYSHDNVLIFKFRSDDNVQHQGFEADYTEVDRIPEPAVPNRGVCGFNATASNTSAMLYSPDWPQEYSPDLNCTWVLKAPKGSQVMITFQYFDTEFCCDFLRIYDGEENIADLQGNMLTYPTLYSTNGELTLYFHSDSSFQRVGFEATFVIAGSEETVEKVTESIMSCWTGIKVTGPGIDQDSYSWSECSSDSACMDVEAPVVLGTSTNANLSVSNCVPRNECSTFSCDQVRGLLPPFAAASFHLCTIHCCYQDRCNKATDNPNEILDKQFDDVVTGKNTDIQTFESETATTPIFTERKEIYTLKSGVEIATSERLVESESTQKATEVIGESAGETTTATLLQPSTTTQRLSPAPCGFNATASNISQDLFSPGWPSSYKRNRDCVWLITARPGRQIRLSFLSLDTELCCDLLEIINEGGAPIDRIGGNYLPSRNFTSSNGIFLIRFVSDDDTQGKGFHLVFEDMESETFSLAKCGFTATATEVIQPLNSPGYPRIYERSKDCVWNINAQQGQQIQINFTEFHTESCCDYVKIYDDETEMMDLRGVRSFETLTTRSSRMRIIFHSDVSMQHDGFQALFKAVGEASTGEPTTSSPTVTPDPSVHLDPIQTIHDISTTISNTPSSRSHTDEFFTPAPCGAILQAVDIPHPLYSPGWPSAYDQNLNCEWRISAREGKHVQFNITFIDIEGCCDHLEVFDGEFQYGSSPYVSYSGTLIIRFRSDKSIQGSGFIGTYTEVEEPPAKQVGACGFVGFANAQPQPLYSPGWPQNYPNSLECNWFLYSSGVGNQVVIEFTMIRTESCCDGLTIREQGVVLASLNGNRLPTNPYRITSSSGSLNLVFKSDFSLNSRGFKAKYYEISSTKQPNTGAIATASYASKSQETLRTGTHEGKALPATDALSDQVISTTKAPVEAPVPVPFSTTAAAETLLGNNATAQSLSKSTTPLVATAVMKHSNATTILATQSSTIKTSTHIATPLPSTRSSTAETPAQSVTSRKTSALDTSTRTATLSTGRSLTETTTSLSPNTPSAAEATTQSVSSTTADLPTTRSSTEKTTPLPSSSTAETATQSVSSTTAELPTTRSSTEKTTPLPSSSTAETATQSVSSTIAELPTTRYSYEKTTPPPSTTSSTEETAQPISSTRAAALAASTRTRTTARHSTQTTSPTAETKTESIATTTSIPSSTTSTTTTQRLVAHSTNTLATQSSTPTATSIAKTVASIILSSIATTSIPEIYPQLKCSETTYLQTRGIIQTPNYPQNYPNRHKCTWVVDVGPGRQVELNITHLQIEECCDYVELLDGDENRRIIRLTRNLSASHMLYTSSTHVMKVVFSSDYSTRFAGLRAIASSRADSTPNAGSCGFTALASDDEIAFHSPNYPNEYPGHSDCYWLIKSPDKDRQIDLILVDVGLEETHDYVTIYDGFNISSSILASLSDLRYGTNFQSSSGFLFLHFHSDTSRNYRGFNATFRLAPPSSESELEECLIGLKLRGGVLNQESRNQSVCNKDFGCSTMRATFRIDQGGLFVPVQVYIGQCVPISQCNSIRCSDMKNSLPSLYHYNMESCHVECCRDGLCSGSAFGRNTGDIDGEEDNTSSSTLQCFSGVFVSGKLIAQNSPSTAYCDAGSTCFSLNALISTDALGNDIAPVVTSVGQCVPASYCDAITCAAMLQQIGGLASINVTSCSTRCCSENLCNAPTTINQSTEEAITTRSTIIGAKTNFSCPENDLYFLPGCTFREYHSQAWICSTLFFNDFPYAETSLCGNNLHLYDGCIIGLRNKCMTGSKSSLLGDEIDLSDDIKTSATNFYKNLTMILRPSYEVFCDKIWEESTNLPGGFASAIASLGEGLGGLCDVVRLGQFERNFYGLLRQLLNVTSTQEFCNLYDNVTSLGTELLDVCDLSSSPSSSFSRWSAKLKTIYPLALEQTIVPKCLALQTIEELRPSNPSFAPPINFTTPDPRGCWSYTLDLMFLVDGSGSIRAGEFPLVIDFVKQIVASLDLESHNVGVLQYSHWYKNKSDRRQRYMDNEIELGQFTSHEDFNAAADSIRHHGYTTFTAHAIRYSVNNIFASSQNFYDKCTHKVIIVITDGRSSDVTYLPKASAYARNSNITLIAIGIKDYRLQELQIIANGEEGNNRFVHTTSNFFELVQMVPTLRNELAQMLIYNPDPANDGDASDINF